MMDFAKLFPPRYPALPETVHAGQAHRGSPAGAGTRSTIVKLASNENPEGPLPAVVEAITRAARGINRYPDGASYRLTRKLAAHLGVQPGNLILGNGSNEVIDMLIRALVSPGENVVFSQHSFIVYPLTCSVHFECGRSVPLTADDRHDLRRWPRASTTRQAGHRPATRTIRPAPTTRRTSSPHFSSRCRRT